MNQYFRHGRALLLGAAISILLTVFPMGTASALENVSAQSAVLISSTGTVLYEKEAHRRMSMASTTKIMTALLTLEEAERMGDLVVDITEEMVAVEGSSMGLLPDDKISLTNLAAGMLLASGNDAANAAALFLAGSQESFAQKMNERAELVGMENTHFVTPSGLDDDQHYSTAYDMALLAKEALKNQKFAELAASSTYQVQFISPEKKVSYTNHNKLLRMYDGCIGVKTGFTKKSGRCLVSAASREGVTLIAVTLNAPDDWNDHIAMLEDGFSRVECVSFDGSNVALQIPLADFEHQTLSVQGVYGGDLPLPKEDANQITRRVLLPRFLYAPIKEGERVGEIQYCLNGTVIYTIPVLAQDTVQCSKKEPGFWEKLFGP